MIVKRPDNFFPDLPNFAGRAADTVNALGDSLKSIFARSFARPEPVSRRRSLAEVRDLTLLDGGSVGLGVLKVLHGENKVRIVHDPRFNFGKFDDLEAPLYIFGYGDFEKTHDLVEKFLSQGLSPNAQVQVSKRDGSPPWIGPIIEQAVVFNKLEVLETLLKNRANPNRRDMLQNTALHLAVELGNVDAVGLLISHGANPDIVNRNGQTPRSLANEQMQAVISACDHLPLFLTKLRPLILNE